MENKTVLVAAEEGDFTPAIRAALTAAGYRAQAAAGREILAAARELLPDVIVLDAAAPDQDAFALRAALGAETGTAGIPVIFLTARGVPAELWSRYAQAADDCVSRPFEAPELIGRLEAALGRRRFYQKISTTDDLTGFHNLHVYRKELFILFNIARRYKRPFSLVLFDVDGLKAVNEAFGRRAGDFVLQKTAEVMRRVFRQPDILIRHGEDEFVVLMPESRAAQASVAMKRLQAELEAHPFAAAGAPPLKVTLSAGIAEYGDELLSENELFDLADKKMRLEKAAKRTAPGRSA